MLYQFNIMKLYWYWQILVLFYMYKITLRNKTNLFWSWMKKDSNSICRFIQCILEKVSTILKATLDVDSSGKGETFEMELIEAHCKTIEMLECDCEQVHVMKYYRVDTYNISRIKIIYYRKPLAKSQSENRTANTCTSLRIIAMCCLFSYSTFITNNIIKYHYIKLFLSFI